MTNAPTKDQDTECSDCQANRQCSACWTAAYAATSTYAERRAARIDRLQDRAEKHRDKSAQHMQRSINATAGIPFGQPILVGHHSEKRHRAAVKRAQQNADKSLEHSREAERASARAQAAETNTAISRQDPDAVTKLKAKLEKAETYQTLMKSINKIVRRITKNPQRKADIFPELLALGLSEHTAENLLTPDYCGRVGMPDYELKNNNAKIRSIKARIEQVSKLHARPANEVEIGACLVVENVDFQSIELHFPGKPSDPIRTAMKSEGWRWARNSGCWYNRRRTDENLARAKHFAQQYLDAE